MKMLVVYDSRSGNTEAMAYAVAEGVESEAIWNALKRIGCDVGQGYYFSRPVSFDGLLEIIRGGLVTEGAPLLPAPTDTAPEQPTL